MTAEKFFEDKYGRPHKSHRQRTAKSNVTHKAHRKDEIKAILESVLGATSSGTGDPLADE
jgi:hypothetical protein